jgi:hypothetical protein
LEHRIRNAAKDHDRVAGENELFPS